jgi:hypothetical protein
LVTPPRWFEVARDADGRPIVVTTTPGEPPRRYRVVGDQVAAGGTAVTFTGSRTGRRAKVPRPAPGAPGLDGWLVGDDPR